MILRKTISVLIFLSIGASQLYSQTFERPNAGLKSHETLNIVRIVTTPDNTVIYLSVENKRTSGGSFCADRNIYMIYPDGSRVKLIMASGIPQCPEYYEFKKVGEKLDFNLTFPPLKPGTEWINILEDCNNNCFSFYGVLLDNDLNRRIDEAVSRVDKGEIDIAIGLYKNIIDSIDSSANGITGSLYSDLISLLMRKGYTAQAQDYYKRLMSSNLPQRQLYIQNLSSRGIKF